MAGADSRSGAAVAGTAITDKERANARQAERMRLTGSSTISLHVHNAIIPGNHLQHVTCPRIVSRFSKALATKALKCPGRIDVQGTSRVSATMRLLSMRD